MRYKEKGSKKEERENQTERDMGEVMTIAGRLGIWLRS